MEEFSCVGSHHDKLHIEQLINGIATKPWLYTNVIKDEPVKEDNRLSNWRKWVDLKNLQTKDLSKKMGRAAHCLLMNDTYHSGLEIEKEVMERAVNYNGSDKNRDNFEFWKTPPQLAVKNCDESSPLFLTFPHFDRGKGYTKRETEIVGIPSLTANEVGKAEACKHAKSTKWKNSKYLSKRKKESKSVLNDIYPLKGDISGLYLEGKGIKQNTKKPQEPIEVPRIEITEPTEPADESYEPSVPAASLNIGGVIVSPGEELLTDTWDIIFTECYLGEAYQIGIPCIHTGQKVIHYRWTQIENYTNPDMPLQFTKTLRPRFFFNKTKGVILPGQSLLMSFWFRSQLPGVFKETWQLITDPDVSPGNTLKFFFQGIASVKQEDKSWEAIDEHVEKCRKSKYAYDMFKYAEESIIDKPFDKLFKYQQFVKEKAIFENINPDLTYDMDVVNELRQMYKELCGDDWDLRVSSFDTVFESNKLDSESKGIYLSKFYTIVQSMQYKKSIDENYTRKYSTAYTIMCGFINAMESSAIDVARMYNVEISPIHIRSLTRMELHEPEEVERDIDFDVEIPDTGGKPQKGKEKGKEKTEKGKDKQEGKAKDGKKLAKPAFIRLKEEADEKPEEMIKQEENTNEGIKKASETERGSGGADGKEDTKTGSNEPNKWRKVFKQHLYILTYEHLCNAIDSLTAALEVENMLIEEKTQPIRQAPLYSCKIK